MLRNGSLSADTEDSPSWLLLEPRCQVLLDALRLPGPPPLWPAEGRVWRGDLEARMHGADRDLLRSVAYKLFVIVRLPYASTAKMGGPNACFDYDHD